MKYYVSLLFLLLYVTSCTTSKDEVVVYTSVDQVFSEPVLRDFEKETGIHVKAVYDTEETKSTGVLNRLIAEKDNPQCDVFWSGDPIRTLVLKNKNISIAYASKMADDIPDSYKDPESYWIGFSARARVLLYNKSFDLPVPESILDLTKNIYKGNVALANPLFGTTTFHIAALFTTLGDVQAKAFLDNLKKNDVIIAGSNGDVKKQVLQGTVFCGITDTDDAFEALKESRDVGIVFLDQDGMGSLIIPNTLNVIRKAPHLENGKKLIDYLLRKETEAKLAISCAQMPLHKGVKTPQNIPSLDRIKPMHISYDKTARKLEKLQYYLKEWLEN